MLLYHGTYEKNYRDILKERIIKSNYYNNNETDIINEYLNSYGENLNLRDRAIFLFQDIKDAMSYEYGFVIDSKNLDIDYLYVADFYMATKIYDHITSGKLEKIQEIVKSYEDNFMSCEEYLKRKKDIVYPEFLYFNDISLDITKTITPDFLIEDIFEEYK